MTTATQAPFETFRLGRADGTGRFCIYHPPQGSVVRGLVLHLPAFAEEMNKSRRMVALTSRALAVAGFAVLQIDLLGCGDSDDEAPADLWQVWLDDLSAALDWLCSRHPGGCIWLWSHRAGCLLASDLAHREARPMRHLLWQPVPQGRSVVQQLLRLKASSAWAAGNGKQVVDQARAELSEGRALDVAGYSFQAKLIQQLEAAKFAPPVCAAGDAAAATLIWLEVSNPSGSEPSPAARAQISKLEQAGYAVQTSVAGGPPFWQTLEIEDAPELQVQTVAALERHSAASSFAAAESLP